MTTQQALDFIKRYPNAKSFVKPSHLEALSPLLEVQVEAVEVRKDEFHNLSGSFTPRKETLDKFAQAAGINWNPTSETTRKEGDGCYVGTAQPMVLGPDGKWQMGAVCEYEFDVDVRLEESKLNGKPDWEHKNGNKPGRRELTPLEIQQERVQFMKVGRQRANTGARSRGTLSALGMQTGFKDLFGKDAPDSATVVFLFSRIIVNAKNEMVANAMLAGIQGNAMALFGPQAGQAPKALTHAAPDAEPRRVGPAAGDDFAPDPEPDPTPEVLRAAALQDLLNSYGHMMKPSGVERAKAALAARDDASIQQFLDGARNYLESQGVKFGGAA